MKLKPAVWQLLRILRSQITHSFVTLKILPVSKSKDMFKSYATSERQRRGADETDEEAKTMQSRDRDEKGQSSMR